VSVAWTVPEPRTGIDKPSETTLFADGTTLYMVSRDHHSHSISLAAIDVSSSEPAVLWTSNDGSMQIPYSGTDFSIVSAPVQENTYILYDEASREAAIVDPGCMRHSEEDRVRDFIEEHELTPVMLLCTHQHFDHVWGAAFVLRQWPHIKAYGNRIDFEKLPLPSRAV